MRPGAHVQIKANEIIYKISPRRTKHTVGGRLGIIHPSQQKSSLLPALCAYVRRADAAFFTTEQSRAQGVEKK
jgi:hypothetical protein